MVGDVTRHNLLLTVVLVVEINLDFPRILYVYIRYTVVYGFPWFVVDIITEALPYDMLIVIPLKLRMFRMQTLQLFTQSK